MDRILDGRLPVYQTVAPFGLLRPFSTEYLPLHPAFAQMVAWAAEQYAQKRYQAMWGYEANGAVIISDDYPIYYGAKKAQAPFAPVLFMGEPTLKYLQPPQGPVPLKDVPRLLGFAQ